MWKPKNEIDKFTKSMNFVKLSELLNNSSKFIFLLIVLADFNQIETGPIKSADNWFNS